jgi:hypothetical protein
VNILTCGNGYFGLAGDYYGQHLAQIIDNAQILELGFGHIQQLLGIKDGVAQITFQDVIVILGVCAQDITRPNTLNTHYDLKLMGIPHIIFAIDEPPNQTRSYEPTFIMPVSQHDFYNKNLDNPHWDWANEIAKKLTIQRLTG